MQGMTATPKSLNCCASTEQRNNHSHPRPATAGIPHHHKPAAIRCRPLQLTTSNHSRIRSGTAFPAEKLECVLTGLAQSFGFFGCAVQQNIGQTLYSLLSPPSLRWLQGTRCLVQIATGAPTGSIGHQYQPPGWNGVDPAAWPDTTVVICTAGASGQVNIAKRGRTEHQHPLRADRDATTVRSCKRKWQLFTTQ